MDYEKKYKEALERAKYVLHTTETAGCAMHKDLLTEIFPELRESEDERIRKELVALFIEVRNREGNEGYWHDLKVADILAYLEKQKPWSEEDERILKGITGKIDHDQTYGVSKDEMLTFLKRL